MPIICDRKGMGHSASIDKGDAKRSWTPSLGSPKKKDDHKDEKGNKDGQVSSNSNFTSGSPLPSAPVKTKAESQSSTPPEPPDDFVHSFEQEEDKDDAIPEKDNSANLFKRRVIPWTNSSPGKSTISKNTSDRVLGSFDEDGENRA